MNFIYDSHLCSLERAVPHAQTAGPPEEAISRKPNVSNPSEVQSMQQRTKKKAHFEFDLCKLDPKTLFYCNSNDG